MARGAHFLSHVLWSAWIVWAVNVALLGFACVLRERQAAQAYSRTPLEVREIS
jgi:membrane-associated PAP2 superfamily phosphatase